MLSLLHPSKNYMMHEIYSFNFFTRTVNSHFVFDSSTIIFPPPPPLFFRHPRLDDQAIFWRVIRTSRDPPVLPIGKCRNFNTANDLASMYQYSTYKRYLISCVLDTCVFSSGMISRVYEPELTIGKYYYH